jgi:PIN domain nuclease of toxin-antitoxin system
VADCVLDASALLATLLEERGSADVEARLDSACISAVNLSEVIAKLVDRGTPADVVENMLEALDLDVRPFDLAQAKRAGLMRQSTREHGLSLGDRACLALAEELARPAVTTDKAWARLHIGVRIDIVR